MSATELAEWRAFYVVEPFGQTWQQAGTVAAMVGNAAGGKKGGGAFKPVDFMPSRPAARHRHRQSSDEMLAVMKAFATAHNGNNSKPAN
jgi:hypothetical protein